MEDYRLRHQIVGPRGVGVLSLKRTGGDAPPGPHVIVLHGLGSAKERTLTSMYMMASSGFTVTAIDLFLHGERPEAIYREQMLGSDFVTAVRDIIYESAADVPAVCGELNIDVTQSGIVGISAGGFTAHVLALQQPRFKAMVAAISSPDWLNIDPTRTPPPGSPEGMLVGAMSPVNHARCYAPIPVCLLNGLLDDVVSPAGTRLLHERLLPLYRENGIEDRLQMVLYPETGHYYTDDMIAQTIAWFKRFLA